MTFKAAVVQDAGVLFDPAAAVEKVEYWARQAKEAGASLVVFPEVFVGGYPKGIDFGIRLGMRSAEGRKVYRRYFEGSIELDTEPAIRLANIAADYDLHMVVGVLERLGGTLHCATWSFDNHGDMTGIHRKLMPTAMERCIWGFGDGTTMSVMDTALGRVGTAICWENYMPLYRTSMYEQGVELYCAPTVDDRDNWQHSIRHIALEGRCFVFSSCQYLTRAGMPEDLSPIQGDDPDTVLIRGGSTIISPLGDVLAGPVYNESTLLTADIDLGEIAEGKFDLDVVGHYSRPDIFQLKIQDRDEEFVSDLDEEVFGPFDHI